MAGESRSKLADEAEVSVNTINQWVRRYGKEANVTAPEAEVLRLADPAPRVDPVTLDARGRLEWEVRQVMADITEARRDRSHTAIAGHRKHLRDLWDRLEQLDREAAEGVDGASIEAIAEQAIVILRHPRICELVMADAEVRKEARRWLT
jgi:transposase-like protein